MWEIILLGLRTLGVAGVGWMISDWFNEKQTSKQTGETPSFKSLAAANWLKWLVIGFISALIFVGFSMFMKSRKK
jgi:hypothetical protein